MGLHVTGDLMLVEQGVQPGPGESGYPACVRDVSFRAFHELHEIKPLHLGEIPGPYRPEHREIR